MYSYLISGPFCSNFKDHFEEFQCGLVVVVQSPLHFTDDEQVRDSQ